MMNKSYCYVIASLVLVAPEMAAQQPSWNNVQEISPGMEIRITGPGPRTLRGTLQSVTGDSVVLNSSAGQETFARQQVTRVSIKIQGHRGRNALIGLGVGAGAGLGLGAVSDHSCAPIGCFLGNNFGKKVITPLGAGVGVLIGALIPSGGWREIYKQ
jgi:hypothetical protein